MIGVGKDKSDIWTGLNWCQGTIPHIVRAGITTIANFAERNFR